MKKATIIALSIVICLAALFWITIETNPEITTRLGFASGPGKPIEVTPDTPNAMVPSIVYEGYLYRTTGKQIPAEVDDSAIVGWKLRERNNRTYASNNSRIIYFCRNLFAGCPV